jgi:hypothetical protein
MVEVGTGDVVRSGESSNKTVGKQYKKKEKQKINIYNGKEVWVAVGREEG